MVNPATAISTWSGARLRDALRLYLVTDQPSLKGRTLIDVVQSAVQGGVTCVQLREKHANSRDFYAQAVALMDLLKPLNVPLIINDRIDIALACGRKVCTWGKAICRCKQHAACCRPRCL